MAGEHKDFIVTIQNFKGDVTHMEVSAPDIFAVMDHLKKSFIESGGLWKQVISIVSDTDRRLDPCDPLRAIEFAMTVDDHYDRMEFLKSWNEGAFDEWPEYLDGTNPNRRS